MLLEFISRPFRPEPSIGQVSDIDPTRRRSLGAILCDRFLPIGAGTRQRACDEFKRPSQAGLDVGADCNFWRQIALWEQSLPIRAGSSPPTDCCCVAHRPNRSGAAMTIHFQCGQCGAKVKGPEQMAGKEARCPRCNNPLRVPVPKPPASAPPGQPPPISPAENAEIPPLRVQNVVTELFASHPQPNIENLRCPFCDAPVKTAAKRMVGQQVVCEKCNGLIRLPGAMLDAELRLAGTQFIVAIVGFIVGLLFILYAIFGF